MLDKLKDKLSRAELEDREECFDQAEDWVKTRPANGADALCKKTFKNKKMRRGVRVDIEIWVGKACVDDPPAEDPDGYEG
jgi:hypothetical protein